MKPIAEALEISRSHLTTSVHAKSVVKQKFQPLSDQPLLEDLKEIVKERPSYGYRRACAVLNRKYKALGFAKVNHKRVYRVMREAKLLLPKHVGYQPNRKHEGTVITLKSNTRWCSDSFQIRCWDGNKLEVAFVMDTCDREILSYVAVTNHLSTHHIQNMLVLACEKRFPNLNATQNRLEWLTDNGGIFTATETQNLAKNMGFIPCQTPAYSPESNGMSEAFVKRFKQDYVQVNELWNASDVLSKIPKWLEDYNENHPHKGLGMRSPRQFLEQNFIN